MLVLRVVDKSSDNGHPQFALLTVEFIPNEG